MANKKSDNRRFTRLLRLYVHYWITLFFFLLVGWTMYPQRYPGSTLDLLSNVTGFNTTYNAEMWFLLPYAILSILAPILFALMDRFRPWQVVCVTLLLHLLTSYTISRYGQRFLFHNSWIYTPLLVVHLLFNFSVGAMAARTNFFDRCRQWTDRRPKRRILMLLSAVALFVFAMMFRYNYFYPLLFTTAVLCMRIPRLLATILSALGRQSMNMWMIHTWLCYYLFSEIFYAPRVPVLILLLLLVSSYMLGLVVDCVANPVWRRLSRCFQLSNSSAR